MLKKFSIALLTISLVIVLAACSGGKDSSKDLSKDEKSDKGMDIIGDNIKFDPNKLVNNGEPINLELWTWGGSEIFQNQIDAYQDIYPNVGIKVVAQPWDDYWTKLPLSLKGKDGPALFNVHNSQHTNIVDLMAPYEISNDELKQDFIGVDAHEIDGEIHYIDYAINTGNIYYNKGMWEEAGLSEADIPTTWDQFIEVAQKLTKKDSKGNLTQAGFNFNGEGYEAMIIGLGYQKGELLFKEDGSTVNFDNKTTIENTKMLYDLYDQHKVGSPDFGDDSTQSFGNGQSAMVYKWGWMQGELNDNYPDIEWGVFRIPTPSEETPFAYDRYNGESTPGINKNKSAEEQEVAQDFLRFILAGDSFTKEFSIANASFPSKNSLAEDPEILEDPVLKTIAPNVDRYIWPGPFPAVIETVSKTTFEDIFYNQVDIETSIKSGQDQIEKAMEKSEFKSVEEKYKFFNEK